MKLALQYQVLVFLILLFGRSFFPGAASASSPETIIITGTGAGIGAMQLMAERFQEKHSRVLIKVLPSIGSTGGIKAVNEGKIDIGLSFRPRKPEEQREGIIEKPYGRVALIFGVQASNPTKNVMLGEIEEIYAGKRKTWPDGTPIRLILRPLSDGFSITLAGISPGLKSASEKAHAIPGVFVGNTDQEAARQIEKTPGSFGTTSSSLIAAEKRKIRALSVDGTVPTPANVSSGTYPYAVTLYLIYKTDTVKSAIKDFIELVFSREGQKLLSDNGHVNVPRMTGK